MEGMVRGRIGSFKGTNADGFVMLYAYDCRRHAKQTGCECATLAPRRAGTRSSASDIGCKSSVVTAFD